MANKKQHLVVMVVETDHENLMGPSMMAGFLGEVLDSIPHITRVSFINQGADLVMAFQRGVGISQVIKDDLPNIGLELPREG
jgi:hypothetical protein